MTLQTHTAPASACKVPLRLRVICNSIVFPPQKWVFSHGRNVGSSEARVCSSLSWAETKSELYSFKNQFGQLPGMGQSPTKIPGLPLLGQVWKLGEWIPALCSSCAKMPHCGNKFWVKKKFYLGKKQKPTPGLVPLFVKGLGCFLLGFFKASFLLQYLLEKILTYNRRKPLCGLSPWFHIITFISKAICDLKTLRWPRGETEGDQGGKMRMRMLCASPISILAGGTAVLEKGQAETPLLLKSTLS